MKSCFYKKVIVGEYMEFPFTMMVPWQLLVVRILLFAFGICDLEKSILALEGHAKPVFSVNFSPNGYHLATVGEDNTCRIWDLRKRNTLYTIPDYSNIISQAKFEPQEGHFLVTVSYDTTAKIWSSTDFKLVKTLSSHDNKVTALDVTRDGQFVATIP